MEPGTLPTVELPADEVELAGTKVAIHSLSRGDVLYMRKTFTDSIEQEAEAEAFTISKGLGVTVEVARAWIETTPSDVVEKLNTAILALSGLVEQPPPN